MTRWPSSFAAGPEGPRPITHAEAAGLGWKRVDPKPWRKLSARWQGPDGWTLAHCGHPTALWPWALVDRFGVLHRLGGYYHDNPHVGVAFPSLRLAMRYVAGERDAMAPSRAVRGS